MEGRAVQMFLGQGIPHDNWRGGSSRVEPGVEAKRLHAFGICSCVDGAAAWRGISAAGAYGDTYPPPPAHACK